MGRGAVRGWGCDLLVAAWWLLSDQTNAAIIAVLDLLSWLTSITTRSLKRCRHFVFICSVGNNVVASFEMLVFFPASLGPVQIYTTSLSTAHSRALLSAVAAATS